MEGSVDSLVLRVRRGGGGRPLGLNELVYVETPSRHTKNVCKSNWGKTWCLTRIGVEGTP